MPKDRRVNSFSSDRSRSSPYPCSSKNTEQDKHYSPLGSVEDVKEWEKVQRPVCVERPPKKAEDTNSSLGSAEDVKEWEAVRCPVCMEHPHNAVLLQCSSYEKGCQPYMCNTSYRHSNCLDQFCKSSVSSPSTARIQEPSFMRESSHVTSEEWRLLGQTGPSEEWRLLGQTGPSEEWRLLGQTRPSESMLRPKLSCPLCRGEIYGWTVVEAARQFMNSKARSCSCETCEFSGDYSQLRKHARSNHPSIRPSKVDPQRQQDWMRSENERELENFLAIIRSEHERESDLFSMAGLWGDIDEEHGRGFGDIFRVTGVSEVEDESNEFINHVNLADMTMRIMELTFSFGFSTPERVGNDMESGHANRHNNNFRQNDGFRSNLQDRVPQADNNFSHNPNFRQNSNFGHERLRDTFRTDFPGRISHSQNNNFRFNYVERMPNRMNNNRPRRSNNNFRRNNDTRRNNLTRRMPHPRPWLGPRRSTSSNDR